METSFFSVDCNFMPTLDTGSKPIFQNGMYPLPHYSDPEHTQANTPVNLQPSRSATERIEATAKGKAFEALAVATFSLSEARKSYMK